MDEFYDRYQRGEITPEQLAEGLTDGSRDIRFHGTALFVRHADRRFLVTARHVLWDDISGTREAKEAEKKAQDWPENMRESIIAEAYERSLTQIFSIIFRVPTLDEILTPSPVRYLMNLGAGTPWTVPYTFSASNLDLAVVSLDQRDSPFAEELERQGYAAISSAQFSMAPTCEGAEVFAVGFPSATAILEEHTLHPAKANWCSSFVSVPTFAFGHVSMLHPRLPFFWCDMSIYPGNSGGPVVEDNRLVGIISTQAIENDAVPGAMTPIPIPFAKVIKAEYLIPLLDKQIEKDKDGDIRRSKP